MRKANRKVFNEYYPSFCPYIPRSLLSAPCLSFPSSLYFLSQDVHTPGVIAFGS